MFQHSTIPYHSMMLFAVFHDHGYGPFVAFAVASLTEKGIWRVEADIAH